VGGNSDIPAGKRFRGSQLAAGRGGSGKSTLGWFRRFRRTFALHWQWERPTWKAAAIGEDFATPEWAGEQTTVEAMQFGGAPLPGGASK